MALRFTFLESPSTCYLLVRLPRHCHCHLPAALTTLPLYFPSYYHLQTYAIISSFDVGHLSLLKYQSYLSGTVVSPFTL